MGKIAITNTSESPIHLTIAKENGEVVQEVVKPAIREGSDGPLKHETTYVDEEVFKAASTSPVVRGYIDAGILVLQQRGARAKEAAPAS